MKKQLVLLSIFCLSIAFASSAQTRVIFNNSLCNHVVAVEWVDMACNPLGVVHYAVNPASALTIIGPGGPFSPFFQMNHVMVDNTTAGMGLVSNPACPGPPPFVFIGGPCAIDIVMNPGADVVIN